MPLTWCYLLVRQGPATSFNCQPAGPILDAWLYHITQEAKHILIVTYGCHLNPGQENLDPALSGEHQRIGLFTPAEVTGLVMPQG